MNEFGAINIDTKLVRYTTERLVEMSNGCICCTLREDLLTELRALSELDLDYILLVESVGIREPLAIAQTFYMEDLPERVRLDSIITVVDAEAFWSQWERKDVVEDEEGHPVEQPLAPLLADQLEFTSIVLLNKADRVSPEELDRLESFVRALNPYARIYRTVRGQIDPDKLLHTGLYDYERGMAHPAWEEGLNKPSSEVEEYGFQSFVFRSETPLDPEAFERFLEDWPPKVVRAKGWVVFAEGVPMALSQASQQLILEPLLPHLSPEELASLPPEAAERYRHDLEALRGMPTELVFIGQAKDWGKIRPRSRPA